MLKRINTILPLQRLFAGPESSLCDVTIVLLPFNYEYLEVIVANLGVFFAYRELYKDRCRVPVDPSKVFQCFQFFST